jgi:hypothetical protein
MIQDYVPESTEWVRVEIVAQARADVKSYMMDRETKDPVIQALNMEYDWFLMREQRLFLFKVFIMLRTVLMRRRRCGCT